MSFFEEGDEPRTAIGPAPPRRPASRTGGGRRPPLDDRTLLARRAGAIGIAFVVVIIVVFAVRAYLSNQETQSLKNYNNEVTTLISEQQSEVADMAFRTLDSSAGASGTGVVELATSLYEDAVTARQEATQAAGWSVPAQMAGAQGDLLLVLDLRYEALNQIQGDISAALGSNGATSAFERIAGAMGMLYSSDVIYAVRVRPLIEQALTSAGIQVESTGAGGVPVSGEQVIGSQFLPNQSWLLTGYVAGKLLGNTPSTLGGAPTTGTVGHKLTGVSVGTTPLQPGVVNDVPYVKGIVFTLDFANSGENPVYGVGTQITVNSAEVSAITATGTVRETLPGQTYMSSLSLPEAPPLHVTLKLVATVDAVPGEADKANNTLTYFVNFT